MARKIFLTLIALVFFLALFWKLIAPAIVRNRLELAFSDVCEICHLKIENTQLSLLNPQKVRLVGLHLSGGEKGVSEVEAKIETIILHLSFSKLPHDIISISSLEIFRPEVVLTDKEKPSVPESKEPKVKKSPWRFEVLKTQLREGHFTYNSTTGNKTATLKIRDIGIGVGPIGNTNELNLKMAEALANAQIENSGHVVLKVATPIFSKNLAIDADLNVTNQSLGDLNVFFEKNDGVKLQGLLKNGHSVVTVRDQALTATARVQYENFAVKVAKDQDRSGVAAFFTNLGAAISMKKKNLEDPAHDQTQTTELKRQKNEPAVSFILRGMKEAAIKVTSII